MLNAWAFAGSLALLTGLLYLVFIGLGFAAPTAFKFLLNAQFLGADVASLFPRPIALGHVAGTTLTLLVTCWVFGYAWAWLYNMMIGVP